ncbi:MAG: hypothetical protein RhofKO_23810 [Rhodothermales bacterium]
MTPNKTPEAMSTTASTSLKTPRPPTKKAQVLSLFDSGIEDIHELAMLTEARPSYVASVLQRAGHLSGYHDLYTSTGNSMNMYSRFFRGRLGFRTVERARDSIRLIDRMHQQFERIGDRAGQHHAMMMALTMYNRARFSNKHAEAEVFRSWLAQRFLNVEHATRIAA